METERPLWYHIRDKDTKKNVLGAIQTLACDSPTGQFCLVTAEGKEIWSSTIWFKGCFCATGSGGKVVPKNYREPLQGLPSVNDTYPHDLAVSKKTQPKTVTDDGIIHMDRFEYMAKWRRNLLIVKVVDIDNVSNKYSVMTAKSSKTWLVDTLYHCTPDAKTKTPDAAKTKSKKVEGPSSTKAAAVLPKSPNAAKSKKRKLDFEESPVNSDAETKTPDAKGPSSTKAAAVLPKTPDAAKTTNAAKSKKRKVKGPSSTKDLEPDLDLEESPVNSEAAAPNAAKTTDATKSKKRKVKGPSSTKDLEPDLDFEESPVNSEAAALLLQDVFRRKTATVLYYEFHGLLAGSR